MVYRCKCEKCRTVTKIDTVVDPIGITRSTTYVTTYGYLRTPCIKCGGNAYTVWKGFDGKRVPISTM